MKIVPKLFIPSSLVIDADDIGRLRIWLNGAIVCCDAFDPWYEDDQKRFVAYNVTEFYTGFRDEDHSAKPWWFLYQEYLALAADPSDQT